MKGMTILTLVLAMLASGGCATYTSARLHEGMSSDAPPPQIFGVLEGREFAKRVQVKLPADLVVAEVRGNTHGGDMTADKRSVQLTTALGEERSAFADVSPLFLASTNLGELRTAAARQHADLMVVTTMEERVRDDGNALGFVGRLLNLLIVPAFVLPGEADKLSLSIRAAVIDVRDDLVYATFQDHREEDIHSTQMGEKSAIEAGFDRLYADSLAKLRTRVTERLRTLEHAD